MALQLIWALIAVCLFCGAATQTAGCGDPAPATGTCSASVTVEQTQPGHGSFVYNNINIQNTGSCDLTGVFVDITLPPYSEVYAYYNVSNQTGELLGLSNPMASGSLALGGTVVLNTIRTPVITLGSVQCDPACSGTTQSTRSIRTAIIHPESESTKIEVQWGANPWWIAIHLVGDAGTTQEVRLSDSASVSQQLMKREIWNNKLVFTFSGAQMVLPLSLELTSIENDKITLKNVVATFSHFVLDTGLSYTNSRVNNTQCEVKLDVHADSNSNWIGIIPQSARAVTQMSLKAKNTNWIVMQQPTAGFFDFASPKMDIQLPISVKLDFGDDKSLEIENAIVAFRQ